MIPHTVCFTGLDIDPRDLIGTRKHKGAIPSHWRRIRFEGDGQTQLHKIDDWIAATLNYAWASYAVSTAFDRRIVVLAFESDTDAVLFKLHGGETAWREDATASVA